MFSLFSKKRHPAAKLYEHYSEDEKLTILAILFLAGTCDNNLTSSSQQDEELYLLNQFVDIFEGNMKNLTKQEIFEELLNYEV